ncbi:MAG: heavy-metal-associated domain-containing protein [Bacteroidales bacterium]|nr:heavy-metal-associated domain-containing protein [Bacteroidales bacterium]
MKTLALILILALTAFSCGGPTQTNENEKMQPGIELTELKLDVKGMTCEGCENAIIRSVGSLEGVHETHASHTDELVTVYYDPELTDAGQITAAIIKTGYEVVTDNPKTEVE